MLIKKYNEDICNSDTPSQWMDRIATRKRKQMYGIIKSEIPIEDMDLILDVGFTSQMGWSSANYLEQYFPYINRIIALSKEPVHRMPMQFEGLRYVQGNGKRLPFKDNSFDCAFSSAVLEHVGSSQQQFALVAESVRVARKYSIFTTPNRWHPVDFHSHWPFLHWLPKPLHRKLLSYMGYKHLASEENLNLLSAKDILRIIQAIGIKQYTLSPIYFLGFISNWVIILHKEELNP